jgi:BsuBI/PstI restriction endonuclease HTH domain/BsuBI/PstI restriction endonuclease domain
MAASGSKAARKRRVREAMEILRLLGFGQRQSNEGAAYVLLSLLDLDANASWSASQNPLRGITPMISFIRERYGVSYAPNTRETIRDEAVKYFVETGMVIRNPDDPDRPTNSGKTVYQIEPSALALLRTFGTAAWDVQLKDYLSARDSIRSEIERHRTLARIPVKLPSDETVTLSPGGQNPLIKAVIEEFCPRFVAGGTVVYIGDTEDKFLHLDATYLEGLGVVIAPSAKMPDIVVHDTNRNWLVLIEAVSTAGRWMVNDGKNSRNSFKAAGQVWFSLLPSRREPLCKASCLKFRGRPKHGLRLILTI